MSEDQVQSDVSFEAFILSLSTTAMVHLGIVPDPATQKPATNLPAARQMIELIGMLQDKTKGNLSASESQLIEAVLFDLRMSYVDKTKEDKK